MAAAKDDPVSVEDNDNIEALLDSADRLSSTISRPFSGLNAVLARIRAASIAQKKELDATLEVCQQLQKKLDVTEAKIQDILTPRLASHAGHPARSRPSPSASSGASSGAAGGAAGGAAEGGAGQGFSDICPLTKCLVSQCLHCRPLSDM